MIEVSVDRCRVNRHMGSTRTSRDRAAVRGVPKSPLRSASAILLSQVVQSLVLDSLVAYSDRPAMWLVLVVMVET